jgi:2-polyprenyl-3-methyl-5-hydroxy-6-metoxy-1,4-benzoquinol methylase
MQTGPPVSITPRGAAGGDPIKYSEELRLLVLRLHEGAESLPNYDQWIAEHLGGRVLAFRRRLVPNILAFTDLRNLDILDFGCGTGSSTVVVCEAAPGSRITAMDIDRPSLEIARARFRHHGLEDLVVVHPIAPVRKVGDLPFDSEAFDFILANGVLEHVVPFGARGQVILEMWRLLRPGGLLYISETPNPLWPIDRHTTNLPFISWLPSRLAYRMAVALGRHRAGTDLEARGRRGMTYWEIVRPLRGTGQPFEVLNISKAGNRLLPGGAESGTSAKRRVATLLLERVAGRPLGALGIPTVALGPFIEHLCLKKLASSRPRSKGRA